MEALVSHQGQYVCYLAKRAYYLEGLSQCRRSLCGGVLTGAVREVADVRLPCGGEDAVRGAGLRRR